MNTWENGTHRIVFLPQRGVNYRIFVDDLTTNTCVLALTYEWWQDMYAKQTMAALIAMSDAHPVAKQQPATRKSA